MGVLTMNSITLPVAYALPLFNHVGAFGDINPARDQSYTGFFVAFATFSATFSKSWEITIQFAALLSIILNTPVYSAMTELLRYFSFEFQPRTDTF